MLGSCPIADGLQVRCRLSQVQRRQSVDRRTRVQDRGDELCRVLRSPCGGTQHEVNLWLEVPQLVACLQRSSLANLCQRAREIVIPFGGMAVPHEDDYSFVVVGEVHWGNASRSLAMLGL